MNSKIKLKKYLYDKKAGAISNRHAWAITVVAEGENIDSEIFVFQMIPGEEWDVFRNVASAQDIYDIPKFHQNISELGTGFYRKNSVTFLCNNASEVEEVWNKLNQDSLDLVVNYDSWQRMQLDAETIITEKNGVAVKPKETLEYETLIEISDLPAGEVGVLPDGSQNIIVYDSLLEGWMPVSELDENELIDSIPGQVSYFYKAENVENIFDIDNVESRVVLYINNFKAGYGSVYKITRDGLYWTTFNPGQFDFITSGNAPWSIDYIDRNIPGSNRLEIKLFIRSE